MRIFWVPLVIFLVINLVIDRFIYKKLKKSERWPRWTRYAHVALCAVLYPLLVAVSAVSGLRDNVWMQFNMWGFFIFYGLNIPKVVMLLIYSLSWWKVLRPGVKKFVRYSSGIVAGLILFMEIWGSAVTPYQYEVREVTVESENLPDGFDGYRITQFSDTHLGFYGNDTTFMSECVDAINAQKSDLIIFTGDLVSRQSSEALPFVSVFSRLHAPDGVLSIRGNHDERTYFPWNSNTEWKQDSLKLGAIQKQMGWDLLEDHHRWLTHNGDSILVLGLRDIAFWKFEVHRHLATAYPEFQKDQHYKMILEHQPEHWDSVRREVHADLMLSGHTHAMQMMVTIAGHRYSPCVFRFKRWEGLYNEGDQQLFINIGLGEVGMPFRIGATPEITVITLRKKKK